MSTIPALILTYYCLALLAGMTGWSRTANRRKPSGAGNPMVTVVVACRNESDSVQSLVQSLKNQSYPHYEVILVNDHSTDDTYSKLAHAVNGLQEFKVVNLTDGRQGKKESLTLGVEMARGEIIVTTDADCAHSPQWLEAMVRQFEPNHVMVIGAVTLEGAGSWLDRLQQMEYLSITATTMASQGWSHPVMCSGANLAFRKKAFEEVNGYQGNLHIASGDDEFLMRKIFSKYKDGIGFLNRREGVVSTHAEPTFAQLMQQRLRWAGKWKENSDWLAKGLAVAVLIGQLGFVMALIMIPVYTWLVFPILAKVLMEWVFLKRVSVFLGKSFDAVAFLVLQLLYPFYVTGVGVSSFFAVPGWKARNIN